MNAEEQARRKTSWSQAADLLDELAVSGWTIRHSNYAIELIQADREVLVFGKMPEIVVEAYRRAKREWK